MPPSGKGKLAPGDDGGKGDGKGKLDGGKGKKKGKPSNDDDGEKGKAKKGKKGKKGKGKGDDGVSRRRMHKKKAEEALEDVDFEVPKLVERITHNCVQGETDLKVLHKIRQEAVLRKAAVKAANDPADFKRQYKCHLAVTGIENATHGDWEVFMAITMSKEGSSMNMHKKLKADYMYSRSYVVKAGQKAKLKVAEKVYTKTFTGSYKELQKQELRMDLWLVVHDNFNQHLGTATRNLYECGSEAVYQQVMVKGFKSGSHSAYDLGIIHLSAMVSEVFTYTITCQNWQFLPTHSEGEAKSLLFTVPSGTGAFEVHQTGSCSAPYNWVNCGQFRYDGTSIALQCATFDVSVISGGHLQGKAIISLGGAGDYPIAFGNVKTLTDDVKLFQQGRLAGGISLSAKSRLLPEGVIDADPSIPAPLQPVASVVMYNLNPYTQYLLIDVASATDLPIADFDLGTSHPFVRVRYDGIVQQSPVVEGSLRPVWNHMFYIPVNYIEPAIRVNPRYMKTLLPEELKSKGFAEIEVWHMDGVPTEFLGVYKFDPRLTRFGEEDNKSVCDRMAKLLKAAGGYDQDEEEGIGGDDSEEETQGIHPKLMKKHRTKVYTATRQKLTGTRLQCVQPPKITFQAYFVPDFPGELAYPEQPDAKGLAAEFDYKTWDEKWVGFNETYEAWYPDAPHGRTFPGNYQDLRGESMPLPYLITSLALPQSLSSPGQVLHWVRCLEFIVTAKQRNKGVLDKWQLPESMLSIRKGAVQDHAVLLCCALIGLRKDAWVCKGTVTSSDNSKGYEVEHAWVMTREKGGCVTFWEATTGAKYHLPGRWSDDPARGPKMKEVVDARRKKRKIRPDWKEHAIQRKVGGRRAQLTDMDDLMFLPFSPWLELVKPDKIVPLPYQSIEVAFNGSQLYGNLGNHSPACIHYDFEQDPKGWSEFLDKKRQRLLKTGKSVAIPVGPPISTFTKRNLMDTIDLEVKESIRLTRLRKGFESAFEENDTLKEVLLQYLDVLEEEITLDIDWRCNAKGQAEKPPGHASPFNSQQYVDKSRKAWQDYWQHKGSLDVNRRHLPVKENHVLSGVPFHFSGTDIKEVRFHIMDCRPIQEYLHIPHDDVLYFVVTKVFPLANSVASVWCWIGVQMPLSPEEVYEIASEQEKNKDKPQQTPSLPSAAPAKPKKKKLQVQGV